MSLWDRLDNFVTIACFLTYFVVALAAGTFFTGLYTYGALVSILHFAGWISLGSLLWCLVWGSCCGAMSWHLWTAVPELVSVSRSRIE